MSTMPEDAAVSRMDFLLGSSSRCPATDISHPLVWVTSVMLAASATCSIMGQARTSSPSSAGLISIGTLYTLRRCAAISSWTPNHVAK